MADEKEPANSFRITDRRGQAKEEPPKIVGKNDAKAEPKAPPPPRERSPEATHEPAHDHDSVDFGNFVVSLSTSALMHMGLLKDPEGPQVPKNLALARQEIDILEMLQRKTRNNLTPQEKQLMEDVLYELRLRFVEASR